MENILFPPGISVTSKKFQLSTLWGFHQSTLWKIFHLRLRNFSSDTWEKFLKNFRHLENFIASSKHLQLMSISKRTTEFFGIMNFLPPVYTNSQNQIRLHKIGRKDRNFPIFFGRTTKIGLILAVHVNEGLWKHSLSYLENIQSVLGKHTSLEFQKCWKNN